MKGRGQGKWWGVTCKTQLLRVSSPRSAYLAVPVGVLARLPVALAFVRLSLEAADRRVPDDVGLPGQRRHGGRVLLRTVELR